MPTLLQINTVINSGSTGRIAEALGETVISHGWQSYIAYGRNPRPSSSQSIKIGNKLGIYNHILQTRLFDRHGLGSRKSTKQLINHIEKINPDIIHLHNIHGYYLNIKVLFDWLRTANITIVWTLHDCWTFTGHCSHYMAIHCNRWQTGCHNCPEKHNYAKSMLLDRSNENYQLKKQLFTGLNNLTIVTPSKWLASEVEKSFLKDYKTVVINNGIDLTVFQPTEGTLPNSIDANKKIILGVANVWTERKGLNDFIRLNDILPKEYQIVMVGLNPKQIKSLPTNIIGLQRTESAEQLAQLYTAATVLFNPTYEDNFPTVNLEALACGTPVVTYNVGGSPETIDAETGFSVECGSINEAANKIRQIASQNKKTWSAACINRARSHFNADDKYDEYYSLYQNILQELRP